MKLLLFILLTGHVLLSAHETLSALRNRADCDEKRHSRLSSSQKIKRQKTSKGAISARFRDSVKAVVAKSKLLKIRSAQIFCPLCDEIVRIHSPSIACPNCGKALLPAWAQPESVQQSSMDSSQGDETAPSSPADLQSPEAYCT